MNRIANKKPILRPFTPRSKANADVWAPAAASIAAALFLGSPGVATAVTTNTCELTATVTECSMTGRSGTGAASTVYFQIPIAASSVGTGLIEPFLTTQDQPNPDGNESGFNSDEPSQFYTSGGTDYGLESKRFGAPGPDGFTNSLLLAQIPRVVGPGNVLYREFLLDINQESKDPYLSLDVVRLFMGAGFGSMADEYSRTPTGYDTSGKILEAGNDLSLIWTLDFNGQNGMDQALLMDYRLCDGNKSILVDCKNGSGRGFDVRMLVPDSLFSGYSPDAYFAMYSSFGWTECEKPAPIAKVKGSKGSSATVAAATCTRTFTTNDGFEEWAVRIANDYCIANPNDVRCNPPGEVPEPGTLALLGLGLLGLGMARNRKAVS